MKRTVLTALATMLVFTLSALAAPKQKMTPSPTPSGSIVSWVLTQPALGPQKSFSVSFKGDCALDATLVLPADSVSKLSMLDNCHLVGADCGTLECGVPSDLEPLLTPPLPGLSLEIQPRAWGPDTFGRSFGFHWADGASLFISTSEPLPRGENGELLTPDLDDSWWQGYVTMVDDGCIWHTGIGVVGTGPGGRPDSCGCGPGFCICGWLECFIEVNGRSLADSLRNIGGLGGR